MKKLAVSSAFARLADKCALLSSKEMDPSARRALNAVARACNELALEVGLAPDEAADVDSVPSTMPIILTTEKEDA